MRASHGDRPAGALGVVVAIAWGLALLLAIVAVALESMPPARIEFVLDPARMTEDRAGAYSAPVDPPLAPWWRCFGDTLASGRTSDLELFEDGRELGPGHVPHDEIATLGGGRYSHWHRRLIFSTSDGTDPRSNGRRYSVLVSARPAVWIEVGALLSALMGTVLGSRLAVSGAGGAARWLPRVLFAITGAGLFIMWNASLAVLAPSWVGVQTDTASYLGDYSMRTIGYPVFLRSVALLFGDLRPLAFIQVNAVLASLVVLALAVARALARPVAARHPVIEPAGTTAPTAAATAAAPRRPAYGVAALLLLFMGTSTRVFETSLTVMADGLYTALVGATAAVLGAAARRPSWRLSITGGVVVGCAILVRPVGLGMVPALLLPWWWHRRTPLGSGRESWWRSGLIVVAPAMASLAVLLGAASLRNLSVHGFFGLSSMGSMSLAGHVAWMISPETVPSEPELARHLQQRIAPLLDRRPQLDWPIDYYLHTSDEYNILLYQVLLPEVRLWAGAHAAPGKDPLRENERLLGVLAISPVLHRPGAYLWHVAANAAGAVHWMGRGASLRPSIAQARASGIECLAALPERDQVLFTDWMTHPSVDHRWDRNMIWERLRHPLDSRPRIYAGLAVSATVLGLLLLPWTGRRIDDRSGRLACLAASGGARLLGAMAVMVWGTIVLISLSATMIFRYVDSLDPLLSSSIVIAAVLLWRAFARRREPAAGSGPREAPAVA